MKKIHFIAIGGSVMHNLALALHDLGNQVTGSDDGFFEPSKSRLSAKGLLPVNTGWDPNKITADLDVVILGMHAKADNPELLKAKELGLEICSFPDYIYKCSEDKQRIVIAGSHGKTTITSMVLHVLKHNKIKFDYAVGATIDGFENMVRLSDDAPIIIIEGDEYLTSPLDLTPKFLRYQHHVAVISGIAWDHINVFPTYAEYVSQFEKLVEATPKAGTLIYYEKDAEVKRLVEANEKDNLKFPYTRIESKIENGKTYLLHEGEKYESGVFGEHNMSNLAAAWFVCKRLFLSDKAFFTTIGSFTGAGNRLEEIGSNENNVIFKDFAHSPSKLKATCKAVKTQFPNRKVVACMELHTFSSLNKDFLEQYKNAFDGIDTPIVYFNPETLAHKKLDPITKEDVINAFEAPNLVVFNNSSELESFLNNYSWANTNLLLMSSGSFDNLDLKALSKRILD